MGTLTMQLNSPITEEQWNTINDYDFERTNTIHFHTIHGKTVRFDKVKRSKWIYAEDENVFYCEHCKAILEPEEYDNHYWNYCYHCGSLMHDRFVDNEQER